MQDNTDNLIKHLIQNTNEFIDAIIQTNDIDVIKTYKNTLHKKWKAAYTVLSDNTLDSEFNIKLPSSDSKTKVVDSLITQHLLRNGDYEIATCIPDSKNTIDNYISLKSIEKGIKENNLEPLKHYLQESKSKDKRLQFTYHALYFLLTIKYKNEKEALLYAINNFEKENKDEIKKLLSFCFFNKKLSHNIIQFRKKLMKQHYDNFSLTKSIPQYDALEMLVKAGTDSMQKLVKASDVFKQYNINYQFCGELPIDLEVPVKYHSLFICPVLKMFCEKDNPPIRLNCGHVISKGAVERISKENRYVVFKCPYCPHDSKISDIKELKL